MHLSSQHFGHIISLHSNPPINTSLPLCIQCIFPLHLSFYYLASFSVVFMDLQDTFLYAPYTVSFEKFPLLSLRHFSEFVFILTTEFLRVFLTFKVIQNDRHRLTRHALRGNVKKTVSESNLYLKHKKEMVCYLPVPRVTSPGR